MEHMCYSLAYSGTSMCSGHHRVFSLDDQILQLLGCTFNQGDKIDGRFDWYPNIQPSPLSPGMHTVHLGLLQFANASTIHLLNDYGVFRVLLATMLCVCAELVGSCCSIELNQNCWCMLRWCKSIWKAGAYDPWLQQMVPIQQNQARYILKGTYLALFVSMLWYCCMVYYCSTYIPKKHVVVIWCYLIWLPDEALPTPHMRCTHNSQAWWLPRTTDQSICWKGIDILLTTENGATVQGSCTSYGGDAHGAWNNQCIVPLASFGRISPALPFWRWSEKHLGHITGVPSCLFFSIFLKK